MIKAGITGSIGSGKSTVSRIFAQLGVPVYNADDRAKWLMSNSPEITRKIRAIFGNEAYASDGSLNRKHISNLAFNNKQLLAQLNEATHPPVFKDFDDWLSEHRHFPYIIKEAALMFESDSFKALDAVIVVSAPEALRIERTMQRDHVTKDAVINRMNNQFTEEKKIALSDYEIINDEKHLLIPQVLKLHSIFNTR